MVSISYRLCVALVGGKTCQCSSPDHPRLTIHGPAVPIVQVPRAFLQITYQWGRGGEGATVAHIPFFPTALIRPLMPVDATCAASEEQAANGRLLAIFQSPALRKLLFLVNPEEITEDKYPSRNPRRYSRLSSIPCDPTSPGFSPWFSDRGYGTA
jgi:hypothetical protein